MTPRKATAAARLAKDPMFCTDDACADLAVLDGKCIRHMDAPEGDPRPGPNVAEDVPEITMDPGAAFGLAAIMLEVTADCMADGGETTPELIGGLAAVTGMPLDVAAGLLMATTMLAVTGELTPEVLHAAAERYTNQAKEEV